MTNRQKDELLLKDLCSRLPYGVKVQYEDGIFTIDYISATYEEVKLNTPDNYTIDVLEVKPYLFPIESMTEDQKKEYRKVCELDTEILFKAPFDGTPFPALYNSQDWLDANHFDYRGLIPMGLANNATGLNIYQSYVGDN